MGLTTTLHITNAYHAASGGIRTFYNALVAAGNAEGRRVRLLVPAEHSTVEEVGAYGRIYYVRAPRAPAFDRRYRLLLPHLYLPLLRSAVIDILEREAPDLVEISDKYSLPYLAAMLRRRWHPRVPRPTLVGLTCERLDDNMAAFVSNGRAAQAFTRWYIRHVYGPPFDAHIAVSEYTASELRRALYDRAPGFVRTCGMGVDTEGFGPWRRHQAVRASLLSRLGASACGPLLLYAGRLSPEKNVGLLVEMMRVLARDRDAGARLVVVGAGPLSDWMRDQAVGELAARMLFVGNLDRDTLAQYIASCDVFVHPNPREPFGIGPLEAMASGVPVVLPRAGGVLEYASDGNAWLAEPTAASFADAVCAACRGDASRVGAAIVTAERHGWRTAARRYFQAYEDIHRQARDTRSVHQKLNFTPKVTHER